MIDFTEGSKEFNTKNLIDNLITANTNKFRYYQTIFEVEETSDETDDSETEGRRLMQTLSSSSSVELDKFVTNMYTMANTICKANTLPYSIRKTFSDNYAELNIIKYNITDTADLQDGLVMGFEDEQFEYNGITVILPSKELVL